MTDRGFRIEVDAARAVVFFLWGPVIVDHMPIGQFKALFGVAAVRQVMHGCAVLSRGND